MFQISLFTLGIGNESVQGGSSEDHSTGQGKEMAASGSQVKVIVRQGKMSDAGHAKEVNAIPYYKCRINAWNFPYT